MLGTDGYGRSDTRGQLRDFFEVSRTWITYTALKALVDTGAFDAQALSAARERLGINPDKDDPTAV